MPFPAATAAALAGRVVRAGTLVEFDFLSGVRRYWTGGRVITAGGHTWTGLGTLGTVSDLPQGPGLRSDPITLTLSGIDETIAALAQDQADEVYGREVQVFLQAFDEGWQPIDTPHLRFWGQMDTMTVIVSGPESVIELRAEDVALDKSRSPNGNLSHFDQIQRHPGDKGLIRLGRTVNATINWP